MAWTIFGGLVCFAFGLALLVRLQPHPQQLHDFLQEWTSAKNFLSGRPVYLELKESVPFYFAGAYVRPRVGATEVNAHPPVSVLLVLPFAAFGYHQAYTVWNVVSLVCLAASLWLIMRPVGLNYSAWFLLPFATFLLSSNSLAQQVNQGQFNLVLLLLLTLAWSAERAGRPGLSGVWIGAAMAIKLFPGLLGLYFLCQRKWSAIWALVLTFVLLNAVALCLFGPDCFRAYLQDVLPKVGVFKSGWLNVSITGFWYKLFGAASPAVTALWQAPQLARFGAAATSLVVVAAAAWKCWKAQNLAERDLAFGTCIIAMLLVSPITWDHYFLMLVLPLATLWKLVPPAPWRRAMILGAIIVLTTVYAKWIWDAAIPGVGECPLRPGDVPSVVTPLQTLTVISYPFYTLMALFVFALLSRPVELTFHPQAGQGDEFGRAAGVG